MITFVIAKDKKKINLDDYFVDDVDCVIYMLWETTLINIIQFLLEEEDDDVRIEEVVEIFKNLQLDNSTSLKKVEDIFIKPGINYYDVVFVDNIIEIVIIKEDADE